MSAPVGALDTRYSSPDAGPLGWDVVEHRLRTSEVWWLSTVDGDAQPHVTPLIAVWHGAALWIVTGSTEKKHRNLRVNPRCALTTGCHHLDVGTDIVVRGTAAHTTDGERLAEVARAFRSKYGPDWAFDVEDGAFAHHEDRADVFAVEPAVVLAFSKGEPFRQMRWSFSDD